MLHAFAARCLLALLVLLSAPALAQDEPLAPEKAFRMSARALDAATIEVRFAIEDGYYMYRDKFKFAAEPATVKLGAADLPPGKQKEDEIFGLVETYRQEVAFKLPVQDAGGARSFKLTVTSQGCWDGGICYPPTPQSADIALTGGPAGGGLGALLGGAGEPPAASTPGQAPPGAADDESSQAMRILQGASGWGVVASFFGFGLLLAFTPCVFPMIPILSGIIVGQGRQMPRGRVFYLSSLYVLAMAVTYALAGVAAGLSGTLLSSALQNPWVLGGFALVFVALSLSMFGFYELQLPSALQSRLSESASHQQGGSAAGVATMGVLSALIVGPCVAAPLAGALLYIAQTGDSALGGTALFSMGLGMGAPLLAVGMSTHHLLPRSGPWMEAVKKFFGVVLLGLAIWIVQPVVPPLAAMLAWAALLILSAMYLHALDPLPPTARGWQRFWKGVGVVALLTGASLLLGALAGSRDPLQPLAVLRGAIATPAKAVAFQRVATLAELDQRLAGATRPVMLDFYADWCVSCKEMERFTFADPQVQARMEQMQLLQVDVTANSEEDKALLKRFSLFGPPGIVFFDARGREIEGMRVIGYQAADRFAETLDRALQAQGAGRTLAGLP